MGLAGGLATNGIISPGSVGPTGAQGSPGLAAWSSGVTYAIGDGVTKGGIIYVSNANSNLNHDPAVDSVNWTAATSPTVSTPGDLASATTKVITRGGVLSGVYEPLNFMDSQIGGVVNVTTDQSAKVQNLVTAVSITTGGGGLAQLPPGDIHVSGSTPVVGIASKPFTMAGVNRSNWIDPAAPTRSGTRFVIDQGANGGDTANPPETTGMFFLRGDQRLESLTILGPNRWSPNTNGVRQAAISGVQMLGSSSLKDVQLSGLGAGVLIGGPGQSADHMSIDGLTVGNSGWGVYAAFGGVTGGDNHWARFRISTNLAAMVMGINGGPTMVGGSLTEAGFYAPYGYLRRNDMQNVASLSSGTGVSAITTLNVNPLAWPLAGVSTVPGSKWQIVDPTGAHTDTFTISGTGPIAGASTITIASHTFNFNYPSGSYISLNDNFSGTWLGSWHCVSTNIESPGNGSIFDENYLTSAANVDGYVGSPGQLYPIQSVGWTWTNTVAVVSQSGSQLTVTVPAGWEFINNMTVTDATNPANTAVATSYVPGSWSWPGTQVTLNLSAPLTGPPANVILLGPRIGKVVTGGAINNCWFPATIKGASYTWLVGSSLRNNYLGDGDGALLAAQAPGLFRFSRAPASATPVGIVENQMGIIGAGATRLSVGELVKGASVISQYAVVEEYIFIPSGVSNPTYQSVLRPYAGTGTLRGVAMNTADPTSVGAAVDILVEAPAAYALNTSGSAIAAGTRVKASAGGIAAASSANDGEQMGFAIANIPAISTVPPAPTLAAVTNAGSTLAAGVYQVQTAYTDASNNVGIPSPIATVTIASGQELDVTSPGAATNATGYYAYISKVNASVQFRQQAAGTPTTLGTTWQQTTPPTSANPSGVSPGYLKLRV